jgi:hypothetical protein
MAAEMNVEQKHYDMLVEHLPYEIAMLRNAYAFLKSVGHLKIREAIPENAGIATFINNTTVEAFWVHTRCLLEFFHRVSQSEGRTACAQDFTRVPLNYDLPFGNLTDSINDQICHLHYARFRESSGKIDGHTMQRVKEALERAIVLFESNLRDDFAEIWTVRPDVNFISVQTHRPSATNVVCSISTTPELAENNVTGPTGPTGPFGPPR